MKGNENPLSELFTFYAMTCFTSHVKLDTVQLYVISQNVIYLVPTPFLLKD